VGLLIGPLMGAALIGRWGLPAPFWLSVVMSLAAAALFWTMPDLDATRRAEATDPLSARTVIGRHRSALLTLGMGSKIVMTLGADNAPAAGRAQFLGAWRWCGEIGNSGGPFLVAVVAAASLAASCLSVGTLAAAGSIWTAVWVGRLDRRRRETARRALAID